MLYYSILVLIFIEVFLLLTDFRTILFLFVEITILYSRLHREALKQSAMDPKTGMIDINILTTGLSLSDRKRHEDVANGLVAFIKGKGKVPSLPFTKTFEEFREHSDEVLFHIC